MKKKKIEHNWFFKMVLILSGPWSTIFILKKEDRILTNEESLRNFYFEELRKGIWLKKDTMQFERILNTLNQKEVGLEDLNKLQSYAKIFNHGFSGAFNVFSITLTMIVAAFIAYSVAQAQILKIEAVPTEENILKALIAAGVLIFAYTIILSHLTRRKVKTNVVQEAIEFYKDEIKKD